MEIRRTCPQRNNIEIAGLVPAATSPTRKPSSVTIAPIAAQLIGADRATALGIEATGPAPVLTLCRELLAAGVTPDQCLEVYRGAVLALRVRSIGEAAKLTVEDNHGRPTFRSWRDRPGSDGAAPPVRQNRRVAG
jgi:hypothetical protein